MSTPGLAGSRRSTGHGRLSRDVKSGLCNALKWAITEGSLRDSFYLKVPLKPETKALVDYLKRLREPCAHYIDTLGRGRDALQWRLPRSEYAAVWRACPNEVSCDWCWIDAPNAAPGFRGNRRVESGYPNLTGWAMLVSNPSAPGAVSYVDYYACATCVKALLPPEKGSGA